MVESNISSELKRKIDQYSDGQLTPEEVDELWTELIQRDEYLDYLKTTANVKDIVKQKREEKEKKQLRKYSYLIAAAFITLLIGVMSVMSYEYNNTGSVEPIDQVELEYYRSADNPRSEGGSELIDEAITLANTGNIEQALRILHEELNNASQPEWIARLNLNLGSLYYNQSQYNKAIKHYNSVISHKEYIDVLMLEKAYWYIGNAYFHTDQLDEALTNIERAYDLNGAYRRVTESYIEALS